MSKKDKRSTQVERALSEVKKGEEESAATVAVGRSGRNTNVSGTIVQAVPKLLGILFLVALVAGVTWFVSGNTAKKEMTVSVEQVKKIATLATAEAHLKVVIEEKDNKLFGNDIPFEWIGTKRELLLVVPGTVVAGVDLKGITSDDIKVNEETKELAIILPRATFIQEPSIEMGNIITYVDKGLFTGEVNWEEGFDLVAEAQERMKKDAIEIGLLQTAEESAERVLEGFFSNLGYTVKLTFE